MSVYHLGRLMESGEYKKCLEEAQALLEEGAQDLEGLARIQAAICRSRLALTDFYGAVEAGREAIRLAEEASIHDVLGQALVDLATAESRTRQYDQALAHFARYFDGLSTYTAARCTEGIAHTRTADTLRRLGRSQEALFRLCEAQRWFERYGDESSAMETVRTQVQIHLCAGEARAAAPLLHRCNDFAQAHPHDREFVAGHLLDQALYYLVTEQYEAAAQTAFLALDAADDRLEQQGRAHLLLCQCALAQNRPQEALSFALAARISSIDGRLYELEFEASDLLFRILHQRGVRLLGELEPELAASGVNLYDYLSERVINRMAHTN